MAPEDRKEAVALTTGATYWTTHDAKSLGIRSLRLADGPHGLRIQNDDDPDHLGLGRSDPATCFPPAVSLASTWDEALIGEVAGALGREARAKGVDIVLGPGLNIKRSPLCGRNFEYYAEDPLLSGTLAAAFVRGLQETGVGACIKHFVANNQETDRLRVNADIDDRALREIYLKGFEIAIEEGRPVAVMSSYNGVNGMPVSENAWLLTEVLRKEWGFDGIVVSDWGAIQDPVASFMAGVDLRMPGRPEDTRLRDAAAAGQIDDGRLQTTVERFRRVAERTVGQDLGTTDFADAHRELTRRAAAEGAVLLTNDGILPLTNISGRKVAVIGAFAEQPRIQGAGSSFVSARHVSDPLALLRAEIESGGGIFSYASGFSLDEQVSGDLLPDAVEVARGADVVLLFLGLPASAEAEGQDRTDIDLPKAQLDLLAALAPLQKPIVAALSNGAPVRTAPWRDAVAAIIEFWLTGQAFGETVCDVLFGKRSPGGKTTETIPLRLEDTPAYLSFPGEFGEVRYGEGIYAGYRFFDAKDIPVDFPFGHGLSYTEFTYANPAVEVRDLQDPIAAVAQVEITNTGAGAGSEIVQLYLSDHGGTAHRPPKVLCGWQKAVLEPGEIAYISLAIPRRRLMHWHPPSKSWVHEGGPATLHFAASSRDVRCSVDVAFPGRPVDAPLTPWSTLGEWLEHEIAGPVLNDLLDSRGGIRGRMGDLLSNKADRGSALSRPLASVIEFPGVPVDAEEINAICARIRASES